jgi:hypothetical protein
VCCALRCLLKRQPRLEWHCLHGLTQVLDEVQAIDHLRRGGRTATTAVSIPITPIATDDGTGWPLCQPACDAIGRAKGQPVQYAMIDQIDEDRARLVAAAPDPLVNPDGGRGRRSRKRGAKKRRRRVAGLVG